MARKRKGRSKDVSTPLIKTADAGQTSKTRNSMGKKAVSRKRKTVSEMPKQRRKPSKKFKKAKSSSSIELVRVMPCCPDQERKKYAKLGLDSALFFSSSKPAKRRQSHISVITISSSDDEDLNNNKTAEWISKMDMVTVNISSNEEPFPSGDAGFSENVSMIEEMLDAEKFRPRKSSTQICLTPESTFTPCCASTPQENLSNFKTLCYSNPETKDNLLFYKGPSFLENPATNLRQNLTALKITEIPHTIASTKQNQRDYEYNKSILNSTSCSPKFYFGPSQSPLTLQQTFENTGSTAPMWSDLSSFNTTQTISEANTSMLDDKSRRQETESRRYSLVQVPSTSQSPVSDPVLENAPKKKKSKSRNQSHTR